MTETITRPQCAGAERDPDCDKWAAYWQDMRQHSITLLGEAFDQVAKDFAGGDARAAIDILLFCADESGHGASDGIYGAMCDLILKHSRALQAAAEYRAGCSMTDLIEMVNTR